jgi:IS30 family transposase
MQMAKRRYRRIDREVRQKVIRLSAKGATYEDIKGQLDLPNGSIGLILRPLGGVLRKEQWTCSRFRLSLDERVEIYLGLQLGLTFTAMATKIGRAISTVSREVNNHGGRGGYRPVRAHRAAEVAARRPKPTKLAASPELCARVVADLEQLWSPQQVTRRLRAEFPTRPEMWVSHETIYKSLYIQGRGELRRELHRCLRTGRAQRRHQGRAEHRGRIKDMVLISERPAEVEDRAVPGHWEGDLILGANNASAIATLVERTTRYVLLGCITDKRAETVREALTALILRLPEHLRRSLTWDQGSEMAQHAQFRVDTDVEVYFCDPHSPWQRGSNENTNGLLRQYFPKGTSLRRYTQDDLDAVAASLNNRPRQTLNWMKPSEKLAELLALTG